MMKIPKVLYVQFKSKRNFGVEIEVNNRVGAQQLVKIVASVDPNRAVLQSNTYAQDYNNDHWHVKFDRSCGDIANQGGWEIASYKARGYKDINKIEEVVNALKNGGAAINDDCGIHVHAEISDFRHIQAASLVAYWMQIEPVICEMLPKHRRNNRYCKPMSKAYALRGRTYTVEHFWDFLRPRSNDNQYRRVALNMCNYALSVPGRRTAELRLPEG